MPNLIFQLKYIRLRHAFKTKKADKRSYKEKIRHYIALMEQLQKTGTELEENYQV